MLICILFSKESKEREVRKRKISATKHAIGKHQERWSSDNKASWNSQPVEAWISELVSHSAINSTTDLLKRTCNGSEYWLDPLSLYYITEGYDADHTLFSCDKWV